MLSPRTVIRGARDSGRGSRRASGAPGRLGLCLLLGAIGLGVQSCDRGGGRRGSSTDPSTGLAVGLDGGHASESRGVLLFFPDPVTGEIRAEARALPVGAGDAGRVRRVVEELVAGGEGGGAPFPAGTTVRAVFLGDNGLLYLDFGGALSDHFPGGFTAERSLVRCLQRTILTNFPRLTGLRLLVNGRPIETLAGHLDLGRVLPVGSDARG